MERRLKIDGTQVENELAGRGSAGGKKSPVEIGRVEAKGKRTVGVNGAPHCQTSAYGLHRISLTASHSHLRISLTGAQLIHSINNCIDLLLPHALHLGPLFSFLDHAIGLRLQRQRRVSFPFFIIELKAAAVQEETSGMLQTSVQAGLQLASRHLTSSTQPSALLDARDAYLAYATALVSTTTLANSTRRGRMAP